MLSFEQARERILDHTPSLESERIPLISAQGRVLRENPKARWQLPPWDNSAMDGFALRCDELDSRGGQLPIAGIIAAGAAPGQTLSPGTCMKIMTGAPLPIGADTVVMREEVDESADGKSASFSKQPTRGSHIRRAGEDIAEESVLLDAGQKLGPGELSILAAQGYTHVTVSRLPRVAILSTGDELIPLGFTPNSSQIISSNNITIAAQVRAAGAEAVDAGIIPDSLIDTKRALLSLQEYDLLLTSGGVSVGDFDHVKDAFEELGISLNFWKAAIKPGKPLAFGIRDNGQLIVGLPGNPASSLVSFELFVRPLLRKMLNYANPVEKELQVRLTTSLDKRKGRTHLVRGTWEYRDGEIWATPLQRQGSGMLRSMAGATCLLRLDAELETFPQGSLVPAISMYRSPL